MRYLEIAVRALALTVFAGSFLSKVARRDAVAAFVASVRAMRLLPGRFVRPVAILVILGELAVCVLVAVPGRGTGTVGLLIAVALLLSFAIAVAAATRRGVREPCRCFGPSTVPLGTRHVIRNLLLAALTAGGAIAAVGAGGTGAGQSGAGRFIAVGAGLLAGGLVIVLDDIIELFQPMSRTPGAARVPHHIPGRRDALSDRRRAVRRPDLPAGPGAHPWRDQAAARAHRAAR